MKKALIFHHALVQDLANVKSKGGAKKKLLQALSLNIIKKYRCKSLMQMRVGIGRGLLENPFHTKCRLLEASQAMKCAVKTFLERDVNSRISACKKDSKNSEQIRFLLHSLKTLHKKFLSECDSKSTHKPSLAYVCRNRPAHIKKANAQR